MNKTFRFIFSALAVMFLVGGIAAIKTNAQGIPNQLLTLMEDHRKSMTSLKADISMVNYDSILKDSEQRTGTVMYVAIRDKKTEKDTDALMRLDWLKPKNEIFSVVKKQFIIWDVKGGIAYTGSSDSKKVKRGQGGGLMTLLTSSSKDEIKSKFTLEFSGAESIDGTDVTHLKLTPKTKQDYKFADIWIDGNGMPLQAATTALNNDTQTIRLSSLDKNVSLDGSLFKVQLPKGVKLQSV
jgi:outer membrane lipoprotein-sorting protein